MLAELSQSCECEFAWTRAPKELSIISALGSAGRFWGDRGWEDQRTFECGAACFVAAGSQAKSTTDAGEFVFSTVFPSEGDHSERKD